MKEIHTPAAGVFKGVGGEKKVERQYVKEGRKGRNGEEGDITLRGLGAMGKAEMHLRFSSIFSVDTFRYVGPQILNL